MNSEQFDMIHGICPDAHEFHDHCPHCDRCFDDGRNEGQAVVQESWVPAGWFGFYPEATCGECHDLTVIDEYEEADALHAEIVAELAAEAAV
jgi:hypothetical protein